MKLEEQVPERCRKRRKGGGRNMQCPIIGEELWSWFVDRLSLCRGRVGTQLLIDQANLIATDLNEERLMRKAQGHTDDDNPLKLCA